MRTVAIAAALLAVVEPGTAVAQTAIDRVLALPPAAARCEPRGDEEVVVCAPADDSRHRLPLPVERDVQDLSPVVGEPARASVDSPFLNGCGIFAGQRRCSKAEASRYGYGNGRDPVTLVGRLLTKAIDPDAETGPTWTPPPE